MLLVLMYHAYHPQHGAIHYTSLFDILSLGNTGVQLFFVLSGFLLFLPYARWLFGLQPAPSTVKFYKRRILRVGPAYWVNVTLLFLLGAWTLNNAGTFLGRIVYLHNLFSHDLRRHAGVLWTMSVEVQYYLVLPLLAGLIFVVAKLIGRWAQISHIASALAVVLVLGCCVALSLECEQLTRSGSWRSMTLLSAAPDALFDPNSMPYWLGVFAFGMAGSFLYVWVTQVWKPSEDQIRATRTLATSAFVVGVSLVLGTAISPLIHIGIRNANLLYGSFYGLVLIGVVLGVSAFRRPFESRVLRFVGHISYSLYLWHLLVLTQIEPHLTAVTNHALHTLYGFLLDAAISIPIAYVSFVLTEVPFFSMRQRSRDAVAIAAPKSDGSAAPAAQPRLSAVNLRGVEDGAFQVGQVVAGYQLDRELGSGAHGVSFEAHRVTAEGVTRQRTLTPERVVFKALYAPPGLARARDAQAFSSRFEQQALDLQIACGILIPTAKSAGAAQYIKWGGAPQKPYLVRSYVSGQSLAERMASETQGLPLPEITGHITRIAAALDYAHAHGICHGECTLENVLIADDGALTVTDIGLERLLAPVDRRVAFTPSLDMARYLAPERYLQPERITGAGDVYSLGVVLYALLCNTLPFDGATVEDVRLAQQKDRWRQISSHRVDVSEEIVAVVARALSARPEERFASAGALAVAFTAAVERAIAEHLAVSGSRQQSQALSNEVSTPAGQSAAPNGSDLTGV